MTSNDSRLRRLLIWALRHSPSLEMVGLAPTLRWVWTGDSRDAKKLPGGDLGDAFRRGLRGGDGEDEPEDEPWR